MDFFDLNNPNLYIAIVLTLVNAIFMCFASYKFFQVLQLGGYSNRAYGHWLRDTKAKWISRTLMLFFMTCVCIVVCNVLFGSFSDQKLYGYIGLVFYFVFLIFFIVSMYKVPQKTPLKLTKRMWRLIILYFFLMLILSFGLLYVALDFTYVFRYASITGTILLMPLIVPLANWLIRPLENLIKYTYKQKSKKKLNSLKNLKIIGITGSYGKTSTKNFLKQILSTKYKTYATPSSFNTPMGLSKVILSELNDSYEIFIAEMGAIRKGDIKEICDFVQPSIAILTSIGEQHLTTFKTKENIKNTKFELIESLKENDKAYFNDNSQDVLDLYNRCKLKNKFAVKLNDKTQEFTAFDIKADDEGLKFTMKLRDEEVNCKTKILGEHNIENILVASSVAYDLGVPAKKIAQAISKLEPASHRLELSKAENGVTIIDDSFNANIIGTKNALKTLSYFENKRKVIVTPGLVELGDMEAEVNEQFGKDIAKVCDLVIIVNKNNRDAIKSGLISQNYPQENIYAVDTLAEATNLFSSVLRRGDVVLLENDLPDNYN